MPYHAGVATTANGAGEFAQNGGAATIAQKQMPPPCGDGIVACGAG